MKKTMMLLLCLLIVVSLFATTALAAAITPRGRIYDKTDREEAASWKTYYYWASTSTHQYTNIAYNSGRAISGHTYILNLKIPASSSITALECSGVFYP